jgi:hypothetical protein
MSAGFLVIEKKEGKQAPPLKSGNTPRMTGRQMAGQPGAGGDTEGFSGQLQTENHKVLYSHFPQW